MKLAIREYCSSVVPKIYPNVTGDDENVIGVDENVIGVDENVTGADGIVTGADKNVNRRKNDKIVFPVLLKLLLEHPYTFVGATGNKCRAPSNDVAVEFHLCAESYMPLT